VTGGLEHPGIVPVYGLGHLADGRPFYAMRFIRGDSLKESIRRFHEAEKQPKRDVGNRTLELRALLGRFIDVCEAVAYAHSRGVLHRDLKPGNIMLGKYGETLVVDWGLAKALDQPERASPMDRSELPLKPTSGSALEPTGAGSALGTPRYMSPEQAAGRLDQLGPWSDVYCLGATLYHLLTGHAPCEAEEVGEVYQKILAGDIPRPRALNPRIARGLEAVCLKAMALKPQDRYDSAEALKDDVERWLGDEPVSAWSEPLRVRARRWMRRHRTLVTAASVSIGVTVIALGASAALLGRANSRIRQQERVARENLDESRRFVSTMFEKVVARLPEVRAMDDVQREILERGLTFYTDFVLRRSSDPAVRHEVGRAYGQIGDILMHLDREPAAEAAYREGLAVLDSLVAEHLTVPEYRRSLSRVLAMAGRLYRETNRPDKAEYAALRALAIDKALADGPAADKELQRMWPQATSTWQCSTTTTTVWTRPKSLTDERCQSKKSWSLLPVGTSGIAKT
jgi:hypothetical protein